MSHDIALLSLMAGVSPLLAKSMADDSWRLRSLSARSDSCSKFLRYHFNDSLIKLLRCRLTFFCSFCSSSSLSLKELKEAAPSSSPSSLSCLLPLLWKLPRLRPRPRSLRCNFSRRLLVVNSTPAALGPSPLASETLVACTMISRSSSSFVLLSPSQFLRNS